ncbi:MAG: hypothetical protein AAB400_03950 [Patescibacteria group bacterium]
MLKHIIEYSFSKTHDKTYVFVPGYSGGLNVATISKIVEYFVKQGKGNVYGVSMSYQYDTQDLFDNSQIKLITVLKHIATIAPYTDIILIAKSLGGSLALFNCKKLPINKIIILGCSIKLGWPQRISLFKTQNPTLPDYKSEWKSILASISIPTLVMSGEFDDITDNSFLFQATQINQNLRLIVVENANHNLENSESGELLIETLIKSIEDFLTESHSHNDS